MEFGVGKMGFWGGRAVLGWAGGGEVFTEGKTGFCEGKFVSSGGKIVFSGGKIVF